MVTVVVAVVVVVAIVVWVSTYSKAWRWWLLLTMGANVPIPGVSGVGSCRC